MLTVYQDILERLLSYDEFRLSLHLFRGLLLAAAALLVLVALFHCLYYLGMRTPIYRKKPPVDGWNRHFFAALIPLFVVLLLVSWGVHVALGIHK